MAVQKSTELNEIHDYELKEFNSGAILHEDQKNDVYDFNFEDLATTVLQNRSVPKAELKIEMDNAKETSFLFSEEVYEHRGLKKHKEAEEQLRINREIERRLAEVEEAAKNRGFEEGIKIGREEVYNQTRALADEKIANLSLMISDVLRSQAEIVRAQKNEIYDLLRNLTKWIILRELKDDGKYLERLLEKLITELNSRANLLIQVNQKEFEKMPDVLESVQERLGELQNVRLEVDFDIESDGILVQSENGIIDGTMDKQLEILDKLFEIRDE